MRGRLPAAPTFGQPAVDRSNRNTDRAGGETMNEILRRHGLTVTIIETPSLGDRSYVVDDGRSALAVDPQRDIDRVIQVLEQRAVQLVAVAETHAHNDYVSGGLKLAREAGVPYLVPCEAEVAYARTQVCGDDVRRVGNMTVRTIGTPGHTPHHVAFAVGEGDQPSLVFTGGSMLFGAVGRTDLVSGDLTEALTRQQPRCEGWLTSCPATPQCCPHTASAASAPPPRPREPPRPSHSSARRTRCSPRQRRSSSARCSADSTPTRRTTHIWRL